MAWITRVICQKKEKGQGRGGRDEMDVQKSNFGLTSLVNQSSTPPRQIVWTTGPLVDGEIEQFPIGGVFRVSGP